MVLSFILIQNRQGKTRLAKWYSPYTDDEKIKLKGEVHRLVAPRDQKHQSNFVEFRGSSKIVYRRYAGLFFCACVDANDNELAFLEAIHFFVEVLDQFFGNVCELDLVFNFYKVYAILDEVFLAGEIQETSKQVVLTRLEHLDKLDGTPKYEHGMEPAHDGQHLIPLLPSARCVRRMPRLYGEGYVELPLRGHLRPDLRDED
ncbi:hypothetical protein PRZ48_010761 [Zasmidium cellare]|uniref:AP-2 complex subunit sigma n=1 Tax=Zasmidium cellare TaxID=395010 RepID=A0ABR0E9Q7_ZASCE|nr:hypothetical protein PRZ48_010761 [Zasmidium cellare]